MVGQGVEHSRQALCSSSSLLRLLPLSVLSQLLRNRLLFE